MLEARDLTFGYNSDKTIYQGFNLTVAPGERVALRAPSGFGKTTLCQMLAGYLKPRSGSVLVDGKPLPRRGRMPVQMVWQHPEVAVDPRLRMAETLAEAGVGNGHMAAIDDPSLTAHHRELLARLGIRDAHALPPRALRRRAAALLHRPRLGGRTALPHSRRDLDHARRRDPGAHLACAARRGRGAQPWHGAGVALPRPHRARGHAGGGAGVT